MSGRTIILFRSLLRLNQKELAQKMGYTSGGIAQNELGANIITFEFIEKFCSTIGIRMHQYFLYEEINELVSKKCKEFNQTETEIISLYYAFLLDAKDELTIDDIKEHSNVSRTTIELFRNLFGLSQKEVSEKTDYSASVISQYELGIRNITFEFIEKFCSAIGIETYQCILYEKVCELVSKNYENLSQIEKEIIALYRAFLLDSKDKIVAEDIKNYSKVIRNAVLGNK